MPVNSIYSRCVHLQAVIGPVAGRTRKGTTKSLDLEGSSPTAEVNNVIPLSSIVQTLIIQV